MRAASRAVRMAEQSCGRRILDPSLRGSLTLQAHTGTGDGARLLRAVLASNRASAHTALPHHHDVELLAGAHPSWSRSTSGCKSRSDEELSTLHSKIDDCGAGSLRRIGEAAYFSTRPGSRSRNIPSPRTTV